LLLNDRDIAAPFYTPDFLVILLPKVGFISIDLQPSLSKAQVKLLTTGVKSRAGRAGRAGR
jgi:hypothetical protein